ncbi:hypothetical protein FJTKL_15411 [Diaporthe vaccinii]|uniref:Carboxylesterase type B domain-containing protein n=1 Tax=Diaporthe vaccinii TaxID=105482 RepID=A0ABR4E505_9PEZI
MTRGWIAKNGKATYTRPTVEASAQIVLPLWPANLTLPYSLRYNTGSRTFRYWNDASFPNISPRWWEGAYHTSELPLLFGTFYLAFSKYPSGQGLIEMGWPAWSPNGTEAAMVFGEGGEVTQLWNATWFETQCEGVTITTGTNVTM